MLLVLRAADESGLETLSGLRQNTKFVPQCKCISHFLHWENLATKKSANLHFGTSSLCGSRSAAKLADQSLGSPDLNKDHSQTQPEPISKSHVYYQFLYATSYHILHRSQMQLLSPPLPLQSQSKQSLLLTLAMATAPSLPCNTPASLASMVKLPKASWAPVTPGPNMWLRCSLRTVSLAFLLPHSLLLLKPLAFPSSKCSCALESVFRSLLFFIYVLLFLSSLTWSQYIVFKASIYSCA